MTGGTQTNLTIICAALRPFHGVYGTVQSHINTHEAGAIERTGHKVIDLPTSDGKITAAMIRQQHELYLGDPSREHLVQPKMVYISQPTEIGSCTTKKSWKRCMPSAGITDFIFLSTGPVWATA